MGKIVFSKQQQDAIDTSDCNLLVSAAAGSGKTAVLVNRVIRKITDASKPVDVDRILVLTFTNAAAAQMKTKISKAILEKLEENPGNANLERQASLIHNAQITTIHSFCLYLIRNNFTQLSIDPAFKVGDTGEIKLICEEVMSNLLEELFTSNEIKNFELLADRFVSGKNINKLKDVLLKVYGDIENSPFLEDYIDEIYEDYNCCDEEALNNSEWGKKLIAETRILLREALRLSEINLEITKSAGGCYLYSPAIEADLAMLRRSEELNTYSELRSWFSTINYERLSTAKKDDIESELREKSKNIRNTVKDIISKAGEWYSFDIETVIANMQENNQVYKAILDTVKLYHKRLWEEKERRKIIDFSDMEHLALQLLYKKTDEGRVPSEVACAYRDYYEEIMVDEYQDSNEIQEYVLSAISGEQDGRYNRFMVGDVKQSIYSFRNACPELFMDKYDNYCYEKGECRKIDLSGNYRSRREVVDATNHVFEKIMVEDFGGIRYDEHTKLQQKAEYPDAPNDCAQIMLMCCDSSKEENRELEAAMVASRIKELVQNHTITDPDTKELRKCEYSDIVILLRSNSGWDEIFKRVLEQNGVPTYIESKSGYFDTTEIRTVLNMLSVLDNPLNEIALYGTMREIFGGFSDNEIAQIKVNHKGYLFDAVRAAAEDESLSDDIQYKCRKFITFVEKYREKVAYTPIHMLLIEILDEYSYFTYVDGQAYGEQRRANVAMLLEKARVYEEGSFKGLYHFIRYISKLKSYDVEYGEASILDEKANVVRITSIHKSKGLEYPVCFVSGITKSYNAMDSRSPIIYDKKLGFGFDYVDTKRGLKYKDLRYKFIAETINSNIRKEEMRVLYVAMTRAKEKLILTGRVSDLDKELEKNDMQMYIATEMGNGKLPYYIRRGLNSYYECISSCVNLSEGNKYFEIAAYSKETMDEDAIELGVSRAQRKQQIEDLIESVNEETHEIDELVTRIQYEYPNTLENLYNKISVSELKHEAIEKMLALEEETPQTIFETDVKSEYIPAFRRDIDNEPGGAQTGSAYHRVMELWHFEDDDWIGQNIDVDFYIGQLVDKGLIDEEDARLVKRSRIDTFISSELAGRMHEAAKRGELYLEQPFVLGIEANRIKENFPAEENVLIQGIIDAFFIEDGKVILMDYKTDKVKTREELVERYQVQLDYYQEAIERITGLKLGQKLIYSFTFGETIEL